MREASAGSPARPCAMRSEGSIGVADSLFCVARVIVLSGVGRTDGVRWVRSGNSKRLRGAKPSVALPATAMVMQQARQPDDFRRKRWTEDSLQERHRPFGDGHGHHGDRDGVSFSRLRSRQRRLRRLQSSLARPRRILRPSLRGRLVRFFRIVSVGLVFRDFSHGKARLCCLRNRCCRWIRSRRHARFRGFRCGLVSGGGNRCAEARKALLRPSSSNRRGGIARRKWCTTGSLRRCAQPFLRQRRVPRKPWRRACVDIVRRVSFVRPCCFLLFGCALVFVASRPSRAL